MADFSFVILITWAVGFRGPRVGLQIGKLTFVFYFPLGLYSRIDTVGSTCEKQKKEEK